MRIPLVTAVTPTFWLLVVSAGWSQPIAVLQVKAETAAEAGKVTLTLASGTKITIPETDINGQLTLVIKNALAENAKPPATGAGVPTAAQAQPGIRAKCEKEWPGDFQMRAYCEKQQSEALGSLSGRLMSSRDESTIRTKCAADWPDDFQMRDYCENQQLKALDTLRR